MKSATKEELGTILPNNVAINLIEFLSKFE